MRINYFLRQSGFTLIELMIAVALGMIIVYTAVAGFRVASQSMSLANRLSLENSLIRSGFTIAHEHLDFWTNIDDPTDTARQSLRRKIPVALTTKARLAELGLPPEAGLPFAPFSGPNGVFTANKPPFIGVPKNSSTLPRYPSSLGNAQAPVYLTEGTSYPLVHERDDDIGFDPTYAWAPHDPRTWFRGNCLEKKLGQKGSAPAQLMGRYGIFTNIAESTDLTYSTQTVRKDPASNSYAASYSPSTTPPHRWFPRQLVGLLQALGYYGLCDYMPSNTVYNIYAPNSNQTSLGGMPNFFRIGGANSGSFCGTGMIRIESLGIYSLTVTNSYGIINPYTNALNDEELAFNHYKYFSSDYSAYGGGGAASLNDLMKKTTGFDNPMPAKPEHWPSVEVGVARYVKSAKFASVAKIRWSNALTGDISELSFTSVATTLRGARMQRRQTQGWAFWDNGPGVNNDPTLDSP